MRMVFRIGFALFASVLCSAMMGAQTIPADSIAVDSLRSRIIPNIGRVRMSALPLAASRELWRWTDARSVHHVFGSMPGIFLRDVGESGKPMQASFLGGEFGQEGIAVDAIPVGDPFTNRIDLATFPLEFLDGIEQLDGPDAILSGARWNFVSHQTVTPKPETKVRFVQETHGTLLSDGMFSQNIARSTNLYFGFQRHTSDGRFHNGQLDSWHLRGRLRSNISERFNLVGSWMYEKSSNGMNGGVDRTRAPLTTQVFDEVIAPVKEDNAYDILARTDLGLTAVVRPFNDSLSLSRISVSNTSYEREYRNPVDFFSFLELLQYSKAGTLSLQAEQNLSLSLVSLRVVASSGTTNIESTKLYRPRKVRSSTFGAGIEGTFSDLLIPSLSVTAEQRYGWRGQSVAAGARSRMGGLTLQASYQHSPRFPSILEAYRSDSLYVRTDVPKPGVNELLTASIRFEADSSIALQLLGFRRSLTDVPIGREITTASGTPAISLTNTSMEWQGLTLSGRLSFWKFALSGSVTTIASNVAGPTNDLFPKFWGTGEISFHDKMFNDHLETNLAIRTRFSDRLQGSHLDPASQQEVLHIGEVLGAAALIDFIAVFSVGDAFITIAWENLMDGQYLRSYLYPMPERRFKLAVNWVFLD